MKIRTVDLVIATTLMTWIAVWAVTCRTSSWGMPTGTW